MKEVKWKGERMMSMRIKLDKPIQSWNEANECFKETMDKKAVECDKYNADRKFMGLDNKPSPAQENKHDKVSTIMNSTRRVKKAKLNIRAKTTYCGSTAQKGSIY